MSLTASLWTSVSGLMTHGEKMNVVGNNIANVSTIGFKAQRMDFNDYLYIAGGSASGPTQIGAGAGVYAVLGDFSQGTFESTNSVTDIAIDGNGFFKVRKPNTEDGMYYSRAGDFYFNQDRELQNPEGYILQGWKIDNSTRLTFKSASVNLGDIAGKSESAFKGTGTPVDIVLDSWYLEPQRTSTVSFTMGLTSDSKNDHSTSAESPMSSLFDQWDGRKDPPLADDAYATSSSIKVYDEGGVSHTLTVYYDQVASKVTDSNGDIVYELEGFPAGYTMYEYVVTIPPQEDKRSYGGQGYDEDTHTWAKEPTQFYTGSDATTAKEAGMLMTGHLIFDASGNLVSQTAYTFGGQDTPTANDQYGGDPSNPATWQSTAFSSNGLPVFTANFTGQPLANTVNEKSDTGFTKAENYIIEIDFGLRNTGNWDGKNMTLAGLDVPADTKKIDYNNIAKFEEPVKEVYATSAGSSSFVTQESTQNGYGSGILSNVNIEKDGVVYGLYDNGKQIPLYQIALYDFHNLQGLYREGGNLYSKTVASGEPRQGVPGDNGFGETNAYYIEQSNVDIAREFVQMISTQRGYQANSKGVTTVDTMLETVIGMKR